MKVIGWTFGGFAAIALLTAIFTSLGPSPTSESAGRSLPRNEPTDASTARSTTNSTIESNGGKWTYDSTEDKMRNQVTNYASLQSDNKLYFAFPYAGGSTGTLTLRNGPRSKDVLLRIDKGQFLCTSFNGCPISIKFDEDPVARFFAMEPSDGTSNVIFIEPYSRFVGRLRRSKKVIIEAEFYQHGYQQIEFSPSGLSW